MHESTTALKICRRCVEYLAIIALSNASPITVRADSDRAVFNNAFLSLGGGPQDVDLSVFSFGNRILPGSYPSTVFLNGDRLGDEEIKLVTDRHDVDASPCLSREQLMRWKVNIAAFPKISEYADGVCIDLGRIIPDTTTQFDAASQTLRISIPQAAMLRRARGVVPMDQLDDGVTALLFGYQLNGNHDYLRNRDSLYASLHSGLNLGPWRFRNWLAINRSPYGTKFESRATYVERALPTIQSRLTVGDTFVSGFGDDGFGLRGIQLQTDDSMRPDSLRGFAPSIRGIARTAAEVTIRQNGYVLYKINVAPGPFVIDDLYATPGAGDLEVTIAEADGSITRYKQPYAALPTLVREGMLNYDLAIGKYRDASEPDGPFAAKAAIGYGLTSNATVYGRAVLSSVYSALTAGVGLNMKGLGALAFDFTHTKLSSGSTFRQSGNGIQLTYAKSLPAYGTQFRLVSTRYLTEGYRSFAQAVREDRGGWRRAGDLKSEVSANVAQPLGTYGSVYLTAIRQGYRRSHSAETVLQLGYATSFRTATVSFNYSQFAARRMHQTERQLQVGVSIPIDKSVSTATYQVASDGKGKLDHQAGVAGSILSNRNLSYSANVSKGTGDSRSFYGSLNYQGSKGNVYIGHSQGARSSQSQASLSGGMIIDSHGPLLSQSVGETTGIIEVPNAGGLAIEGYPGVATDSSGRAVVPSLVPYRKNRVAVNAAQTATSDVDLLEPAVSVAPTRGAVTYSKLKADIGKRLFVRLTLPDGEKVPFGARITDRKGKEKGAVGTMGRAYLTGLEAGPSSYAVDWGSARDKNCTFSVHISQTSGMSDDRLVDAVCNFANDR